MTRRKLRLVYGHTFLRTLLRNSCAIEMLCSILSALWFTVIRVMFHIGDKSVVVVFTRVTIFSCNLQMYINCPGGSTYSIMAIYDAMQWVSLSFVVHVVTIHQVFYVT